jgi:hypothetical protein
LGVGGDRVVDHPLRRLALRPVQKPGELDARFHGARIQPDGIAQKRFGLFVVMQTGRSGA